MMRTQGCFSLLHQHMMTISKPPRVIVMLCYMSSSITKQIMMITIIIVIIHCLTLIVLLVQFNLIYQFFPNSGSNSSLTKFQMPSIKWFSRSDSNKAIWDRLDDQAKSVILGYVPPTNTDSSSQPPFSKPPFTRPLTGKSGFTTSSPGTQTKLHVISANDFLLANMFALKSGDEIKVNPNDEPVDLPPDTPLINADNSKGKPIPPGDIRCVMYKSFSCHFLLKLNTVPLSMILLPLRICQLLTKVPMVVLLEKMCA
jgi:hypothetical protein